MNVLLVGGGGREHALAWKILQSSQLKTLFVAPGNAGTRQLEEMQPGVVQHLNIVETDITQLLAFTKKNEIDLAIIGPEGPLALGLSDALRAQGVPCFGPSQAAAQLETSKAFSKKFMYTHHIPTARYHCFEDAHLACTHVKSIDYPVVIKASGLAAGKGVFLPADVTEAQHIIRQLLDEKILGSAGKQIVIEERLEGREVSLLAFTDGHTVRRMPLACDHKRLFDHDEGPNTGGMGAYAPAPWLTEEELQKIETDILQKTVDAMHSEGHPYVGVLYAGLMLTEQGPRVLEFNCRFGDPETQVLIPLLESDFLSIANSCVNGRLASQDIRWHDKSAACVVVASKGYPQKAETGDIIHGLSNISLAESVQVFMAGAAYEGRLLKTNGGRVLAVSAQAENLSQALEAAYQEVQKIQFEGMQYRRDIGAKVLDEKTQAEGDAYRAAGVDIAAGNRTVALMKEAVRATYGPEVLAGIGAFGGMYHAGALKSMNDPVLVASTDGVGTKVELGLKCNRVRSLGHDIVNHSINDILVQGARPLFFLDYVASAKLQPEVVADIVGGMAEACRAASCALLGGETAEMPGTYHPGKLDIAGTIIGVVERAEALPRTEKLTAGDVLIGIASSGPHTNGYSLLRKIFTEEMFEEQIPELGVSVLDALLAPHRNYFPVLHPLITEKNSLIKGLVHLTGGGVFENIPRILPEHLSAEIFLKQWPKAPLFELAQKRGGISTPEMYRVFNMGIGMILVVGASDVKAMQEKLGEPSWAIGQLVSGTKEVQLV